MPDGEILTKSPGLEPGPRGFNRYQFDFMVFTLHTCSPNHQCFYKGCVRLLKTNQALFVRWEARAYNAVVPEDLQLQGSLKVQAFSRVCNSSTGINSCGSCERREYDLYYMYHPLKYLHFAREYNPAPGVQSSNSRIMQAGEYVKSFKPWLVLHKDP